jgi:uncharacterized protein (TIGR03435 family)
MKRRSLACSAAVLAFATSVVLAQSPSAPKAGTTTKPLTWDVISVKPNHSLDPSSFMRWTIDGIELRNATLHELLLNAFEVRSESQITGYPGWVNSEHFDIEAKMDADTVAAYHALTSADSKDQWHTFMQQILDERFAMKFHIEKRDLPVYNLVVASQGLKLKPSAKDENSSSSMGRGKYSAHRGQVGGLAFSLSGTVGRVIFDKTGLTGEYDIDLRWSPDDESDSGPSIFSALQDQLGLKLESAKAPVDVVVIDRLERPSAN